MVLDLGDGGDGGEGGCGEGEKEGGMERGKEGPREGRGAERGRELSLDREKYQAFQPKPINGLTARTTTTVKLNPDGLQSSSIYCLYHKNLQLVPVQPTARNAHAAART